MPEPGGNDLVHTHGVRQVAQAMLAEIDELDAFREVVAQERSRGL